MTSLRQRMIEDMRVRNLAVGTQTIYLRHVSQFARHFGKSPAALGREQIRSFQVYLIQEKKLDPSTITVAVSAIRFLYKVTLRRQWNFDEIIPAPSDPGGCLSFSAQRRSCNFSAACRRSNIARS